MNIDDFKGSLAVVPPPVDDPMLDDPAHALPHHPVDAAPVRDFTPSERELRLSWYEWMDSKDTTIKVSLKVV